jgi:hypothetical protein
LRLTTSLMMTMHSVMMAPPPCRCSQAMARVVS